jgi:hypothetical protein
MGFDPVEVRLGDPPLAGDAFVDQGLAVGGKGGDLSFDGSFYSVTFLGPSLDCNYSGVLRQADRLKRGDAQVLEFLLRANVQAFKRTQH